MLTRLSRTVTSFSGQRACRSGPAPTSSDSSVTYAASHHEICL